MADWDTQQSCLDSMTQFYADARQAWLWSDPYLSAATDFWYASDYVNCLGNLLGWATYVWDVLYRLIAYDANYEPHSVVPYYSSNYGGVTWESIVEAWMRNDYEGRVWTIGVIDKMRQILWDEPFDLTFAARPEGGTPD